MTVITSPLGEFEDRLGLKQGTMEHLLTEQSDWGLVVKAHGIVEAALNVRLARRFPDLAQVVTRLPYDHGRYGKLVTLEAGGWLTAHEMAFLRAFHKVRSALVHDVSYLDFSLDEVTERWTAKERDQFLDKVIDFWEASNKIKQNAVWREAEKQDVRQLLFAATWRFVYDTNVLLLGPPPTDGAAAG